MCPTHPAAGSTTSPLRLLLFFRVTGWGFILAKDVVDLAVRTAQTIRLEGGNDIVYQPLIRARLGMLDLAWFKQQVRYCLMPNGIVQDRVRQTRRPL